MSYQLVAEVLDHAPDMTPTERLVLVAIAEVCRLNSRQADVDAETLTRRTGVDTTNVRGALRRLATRGLDVRVALGKDKNGKPVYAHKGRVARYQVPELPVPEGCDCDTCTLGKGERQRPPLGAVEGGRTTTQGGRERPPIDAKGGRLDTKGGRVSTKGGRWDTQRRTQASTHPSVPPPSGVVPDQKRAGRRARDAIPAPPAPAPAPPSPRVARPPDWREEIAARPPVIDGAVNSAGRQLCDRVLVEGPAVVDQLRPPPPVPVEVIAVGAVPVPLPDLDHGSGNVLQFRSPKRKA